MHVDIPVLAVLGHKNSGKTTVVEGLISELLKRSFRVASAKHVSQEGFSMDSDGSDTWHHSAAGASPVLAVSDFETNMMIRTVTAKSPLEEIVALVQKNGANILVLEGFSSIVWKDCRVGKIVCVRSHEEYKKFRYWRKREVVAFCSIKPFDGLPILRIKEDFPILIDGALRFIEKKQEILRILGRLPGSDCRKCGRKTCEDLAEDIQAGKACLEDCVTWNIMPKLKSKVMVGNTEVPMHLFVSEFIRKTVLGMLSALKKVNIEGTEDVHIIVSQRDNT